MRQRGELWFGGSPPACRYAAVSGWRKSRRSQTREGCRGRSLESWAGCLWALGPCYATWELGRECSSNLRWSPGLGWRETSAIDKKKHTRSTINSAASIVVTIWLHFKVKMEETDKNGDKCNIADTETMGSEGEKAGRGNKNSANKKKHTTDKRKENREQSCR